MYFDVGQTTTTPYALTIQATSGEKETIFLHHDWITSNLRNVINTFTRRVRIYCIVFCTILNNTIVGVDNAGHNRLHHSLGKTSIPATIGSGKNTPNRQKSGGVGTDIYIID